MSVDVTSEIVIARSRVEVAAYSSNPLNAPAWYANIESVELVSPPPVRVGSRIAFIAHFLGKRLAYTYEVVEHVLSERFVMRTAEGPFPMETTYTWDSTPDGHTRMTLRNRGRPAGFSRLVKPLMGRAIANANRKDLLALKRLIENSEAASA